MPACTKYDIMRAVAESGFTRALSNKLVEILIARIKLTLVSGEDVLISGFGRFKVRAKKARKGRNPATGETLMLEPRKTITFHCSGKLRKRLNQ